MGLDMTDSTSEGEGGFRLMRPAHQIEVGLPGMVPVIAIIEWNAVPK